MRSVVKSVLYHHERWDGKGYPMGLKGEIAYLVCEENIKRIIEVYQKMKANFYYFYLKNKSNRLKCLQKKVK